MYKRNSAVSEHLCALVYKCGSEPRLVAVIDSYTCHSDKQTVVLEVVSFGGSAVVQHAVRDEIVVAPAATTRLRTCCHTVTNIAFLPVKEDSFREVPSIFDLIENLDGHFSSEWPS